MSEEREGQTVQERRREVLVALAQCARSWHGDVCLLGNLRADEIGDACEWAADELSRAARLEEAVSEFLAAEDAVDREAERAGGTPGWSSAPIVRRIRAVERLRALTPTGGDDE